MKKYHRYIECFTFLVLVIDHLVLFPYLNKLVFKFISIVNKKINKFNTLIMISF